MFVTGYVVAEFIVVRHMGNWLCSGRRELIVAGQKRYRQLGRMISFRVQYSEMMALSITQQQPSGQNLQTYTIYRFASYFWVTAKAATTGITSQLKIERKSHNITQIQLEQIMPANYEQKIVCSGLVGLLPVLNHHFLLFVDRCRFVCCIQDTPVYEIQKVGLLSCQNQDALQLQSAQQQKINAYVSYLKNYLLVEGYYFAFRYDLSLSRSAHAAGFPSKKKFLWNLNIGQNFQKLEDRRWFLGLIQGSIRSFKVTLNETPLEYILITRRSWTKGGTRFNSRGVDSKGNVANFCETEQLLMIKGHCFSHVQIRGSVPAFWKQTGITQEVDLDSNWDKNKLAFKQHVDKALRHYNRILCVNLLCLDRRGEDQLTYCFQNLVKQSKIKQLRYEYFDVHCASKGQKFQRCNYLITQKLKGINQNFGFYREDLSAKTVLALQRGVVRVNCLDNLDRTNLIQSKIAYQVLTLILQTIGIDVKAAVGAGSILAAADNIENGSIFVIQLKNAWADNGDMISKHYTGTGSTHTNITRTGKRDIKGLFDHGLKSCLRLYQQFVDDNTKQQVIDIILGEHTETVNLAEIEARLKQLQDKGEVGQYSQENLQNW